MHPDELEEVEPPGDPVDPSTLYEWVSSEMAVTIVDIRNRSEFEEWHISGPSVTVANIPAYDFIDDENDAVLQRLPDGDPLVIVCAEGKSSALIAGWLTDHGFDARNLEAGMEGWARVYVSSEVTGYDGPGTLHQYYRPSSGCLGYMLQDGSEAVVFDPLQAFTDRYLADAEERGVELVYAVDTHIHADHVSGVRALVDAGVEGLLPASAIERGVTYESAITGLEDGDTVSVGSATVEAVHTPGHTTGMTSYLVGDSVLLTGDGLFTESVARPDLEEGNEGAPEAAIQLYRSIQDRIRELPGDTIIGGGHTSEGAEPGPDGTYTARLDSLVGDLSVLELPEAEFVDRILSDMPPRPANFERIIAINLGQAEADPEEAFELELGPNNCATSREALT
mgnify:CR=1 FL=1